MPISHRAAGRERLASRRESETIGFWCAGFNYTATISRFADNSICEIFINSEKCGSDADTNARGSAMVCSIALQHGLPLDTIKHALTRDARGAASGPLAVALDLIERVP
jgi:hypothetical protein